MRALVTGATGFIGWHLAERLRDEGWHVRALVRPETAKPLPRGVERRAGCGGIRGSSAPWVAWWQR